MIPEALMIHIVKPEGYDGTHAQHQMVEMASGDIVLGVIWSRLEDITHELAHLVAMGKVPEGTPHQVFHQVEDAVDAMGPRTKITNEALAQAVELATLRRYISTPGVLDSLAMKMKAMLKGAIDVLIITSHMNADAELVKAADAELVKAHCDPRIPKWTAQVIAWLEEGWDNTGAISGPPVTGGHPL